MSSADIASAAPRTSGMMEGQKERCASLSRRSCSAMCGTDTAGGVLGPGSGGWRRVGGEFAGRADERADGGGAAAAAEREVSCARVSPTRVQAVLSLSDVSGQEYRCRGSAVPPPAPTVLSWGGAGKSTDAVEALYRLILRTFSVDLQWR
eukprot:1119300-Rhodomonas_salina.2